MKICVFFLKKNPTLADLGDDSGDVNAFHSAVSLSKLQNTRGARYQLWDSFFFFLFFLFASSLPSHVLDVCTQLTHFSGH